MKKHGMLILLLSFLYGGSLFANTTGSTTYTDVQQAFGLTCDLLLSAETQLPTSNINQEGYFTLSSNTLYVTKYQGSTQPVDQQDYIYYTEVKRRLAEGYTAIKDYKVVYYKGRHIPITIGTKCNKDYITIGEKSFVNNLNITYVGIENEKLVLKGKSTTCPSCTALVCTLADPTKPVPAATPIVLQQPTLPETTPETTTSTTPETTTTELPPLPTLPQEQETLAPISSNPASPLQVITNPDQTLQTIYVTPTLKYSLQNQTTYSIATQLGYNRKTDRYTLAKEIGITDYRGTKAQNLLIREYLLGKLQVQYTKTATRQIKIATIYKPQVDRYVVSKLATLRGYTWPTHKRGLADELNMMPKYRGSRTDNLKIRTYLMEKIMRYTP